jgi:Rps23 Pro-64 3,4-dihydroxylase Tpa1-like proline 4-hydroxylase
MSDLLDLHLNPLDVAALQASFASTHPTHFVCIDGLLRPEFASEVAAAYPSFEEARQKGREFRAVNEILKVQVSEPAHFPEPVLRLHRVLSSPEWLTLVSEVTGIPKLLADDLLAGGGMHLYAPGSHLDVHVDFNHIVDRGLHRRLNILVFLNPGWREDWGGQFELWDPEVRRLLRAFVPVMNRCVIFATTETSYHGVPKVRCPSEVSRNSFAAYYYTPISSQAVSHSTLFRARPDEKLKGALWMPLERLSRRAREGARELARRLRKR